MGKALFFVLATGTVFSEKFWFVSNQAPPSTLLNCRISTSDRLIHPTKYCIRPGSSPDLNNIGLVLYSFHLYCFVPAHRHQRPMILASCGIACKMYIDLWNQYETAAALIDHICSVISILLWLGSVASADVDLAVRETLLRHRSWSIMCSSRLVLKAQKLARRYAVTSSHFRVLYWSRREVVVNGMDVFDWRR